MTGPHDAYAERAVVGAVLAAGRVPEDVAAILRPSDIFDPPLRAVVEAAWDLTAQGKPVDPLTIRADLLRRGDRSLAIDGVWLATLAAEGLPVAGAHHARIVREMSVRRDVVREGMRAIQAAENPSQDPYDVAAFLSVNAANLAERGDPTARTSARDLHDFVKGELDYDWLVPDLLERGDRLLLTGVEGGGKSFLIRQLAVCAAAGVHPFTGQRHPSLRVLFIDLENGERTLRRNLIALRKHADRIKAPVPIRTMMVESLPAGVDLTQVEGEAWLSRLCEDNQPEVLVVGPLYRMHNADMGKEEPARQLTHVIDVMRARHGCAVLMETHAPHAGQSGRALRPVGSSLFMRWPEFGLGIREDKNGLYKLVRWRGARDERSWPTHLRRGGDGEWPWVPADPPNRNASLREFWEQVEEGEPA